jgi:hypothetical protein
VNQGRYDDVAACFTPEYLRREFDAPPYASKIRTACELQLADCKLQPSPSRDQKQMMCMHPIGPLKRVPGERARQGRAYYHFRPLGRLDWAWDVTFVPRRGGWLISDMRLNRQRSWAGDDLEYVQGPAGTGRVRRVEKR